MRILAALALGFVSLVSLPTARADDAGSTTQPASSGSVTIKVVDAEGNPVVGAKVQLIKPHKKGDAGEVGKHAAPVAEGQTDAQGAVTLSGVAEGSYRAIAVVRKGGRGAAKVTVGDDAGKPITITLKAKKAKGDAGSATTQPA